MISEIETSQIISCKNNKGNMAGEKKVSKTKMA